MTFQFRNRPYVTQGGGDPQSVVNFLGDIKGYLTHQSLRVVGTYNYVRFKSHRKKSHRISPPGLLCEVQFGGGADYLLATNTRTAPVHADRKVAH